MKILIIEDDPSLCEIIRITLEKERFITEIANNYQTALTKIEDYTYDCILLDIMLPDGNGLSLLETLKKEQKTSNIIIISAKDSLEDKVQGLNLGADDYLPKPFHLAELIARVKSVIRRNHHAGSSFIEYGNIRIDPFHFQVTIDNKNIELNRKEYDILLYFIQQPERVINKITLAEAVWGDHIDQVDNFDFIYAQVKNLRKRLTEAQATAELKAVYGFGYKMTLK